MLIDVLQKHEKNLIEELANSNIKGSILLEYIDENGTTKYCCGTKILPLPLVQEKPLPIKL